MDLTCPKCQGAMRTYERSGITVDQCSECRGIFLDRGELEKLVDAETSFHGAPAAAAPAAPAAAPSYGTPPRHDDRGDRGDRDREYRDREYREREYRDRDRGYRDDDYRGDRKKYDDDDYRTHGGYDPRKKRKKSIFEELFD